MPPLTLTWDLVIIVFVAIVVAYSFIVGRAEAMKIIIAVYVASVAVQGIGGVIAWLFQGSSRMLDILGMEANVPALTITKLLLLVGGIIILTVRSGVSVEDEGPEGLVGTLYTGVCGLATALLLLTVLLTYIADAPLLDLQLRFSPALAPLLAQSRLVEAIIGYQQLWFALPAGLLAASGFIRSYSA